MCVRCSRAGGGAAGALAEGAAVDAEERALAGTSLVVALGVGAFVVAVVALVARTSGASQPSKATRASQPVRHRATTLHHTPVARSWCDEEILAPGCWLARARPHGVVELDQSVEQIDVGVHALQPRRCELCFGIDHVCRGGFAS